MVLKELREALPPAVFFLVLFHMMALTRAVSAEDYSITALRAVSATVTALVVAKAILIVEALPLSRAFSSRVIPGVLWKSVLYGLVVLVFKTLEEAIHVVPGVGGLGDGLREMVDGVRWPVFAVLALWVFWGLVLYCLVAELVRELGAGEGARPLWRKNRPPTDEPG